MNMSDLTTVTNQNWSRRALLSSLAITTLGGCIGNSIGSGDGSNANGTSDETALSAFWEYELRGRTGSPVVEGETVFVAGTTYGTDSDTDDTDGGTDDSNNDGNDASSTGHVFALDKTNGQRQWHVDGLGGGIPFTPHLADSTLVVVDNAGTISGIDVESRERSWSADVSATPTTRPFAGQDALYVGYDDGLRRVDPKSGDVQTVLETEYGIDFAAGANRPYVGSRRPTEGKTVVQTVGNGGSAWTQTFDSTGIGGIAATLDRVFVTAGRKLVALSPDSGETLWSTEVGKTVGEPFVTDESVYVATNDGVGAYLRKDGTERWSETIDGGATTGPAVSKKYLFVGADGGLRAFGADSGDPAGTANFKDGQLTTRPTTTGNRVFVGNFETRSTGYDGRIYSFDIAPK